MFGKFKKPKPQASAGAPSVNELRALAGHVIRESHFQLRGGRSVQLQQMYIQLSDLGWSEGSPDRIRATVLQELPERARRAIPGNAGFFLSEPPPGPLPLFTFFVGLHCYEPLQPSAHCSSLIVVWFDHALPADLRSYILAHTEQVNWERYAKDGYY